MFRTLIPFARLRSLLPPFCLFLTITLAIQWTKGAFQGEFGSHPDEPAHFVTALMVHDYVADLFPAPPMQYAENYYLHYPKVGLGHWPPVFYVVQAGWMMLFSESRISMMLLMAVVAALFGVTLYEVVRRRYSASAGLAAGVFMVPALLTLTEGSFATNISKNR